MNPDDPIWRDWSVPSACGAPLATGGIRARPDDFFVDEQLGFEPSGAGEHLLVRVEAAGLTTGQAVEALSASWKTPARAFSWSGLKDRHAVTRQWLSLPWPIKRELPDDVHLDAAGPQNTGVLRVLGVTRHDRKLRVGTHQGNAFRIRMELDRAIDGDQLNARVATLAAQGCPNAFGSQRFGYFGDNAARFLTARADRRGKTKPILLSAMRSLAFNRVLAERVRAGTWNAVQMGDWVMLSGSRSGFMVEDADALSGLQTRCAARDLSPTGLLPGTGAPRVVGETLALEQSCLAPIDAGIEKLKAGGMRADRRSLRLLPEQLKVSYDAAAQAMVATFSLTAGSYATTLLSQLVDVKDLSSK